jgi:hypothetical protein
MAVEESKGWILRDLNILATIGGEEQDFRGCGKIRKSAFRALKGAASAAPPSSRADPAQLPPAAVDCRK